MAVPRYMHSAQFKPEHSSDNQGRQSKCGQVFVTAGYVVCFGQQGKVLQELGPGDLLHLHRCKNNNLEYIFNLRYRYCLDPSGFLYSI